MRKGLLVPVVAVVAVLVSSGVAFAQATDPSVGTWKLNVAASKYDPGPPPKSSTRTVEDLGGGVFLTTIRGVNAQGAPTWSHYVFKFDGREYPYAASTATPNTSPVFTTVSYKRVDANTFESTFKADGKVTTTNTYTISKDGKLWTARQKGTNAQGKPTNNVIVSDKQ